MGALRHLAISRRRLAAGSLKHIRMRRHVAEAAAMEDLAAEWLRLLPDLLAAAAHPSASPALIFALFQVRSPTWHTSDQAHRMLLVAGQKAYEAPPASIFTTSSNRSIHTQMDFRMVIVSNSRDLPGFFQDQAMSVDSRKISCSDGNCKPPAVQLQVGVMRR